MKNFYIALICLTIATTINGFSIISIKNDMKNEKVVKTESNIAEEKETSYLVENELRNCPFCDGKVDYNFITNNNMFNEKYTSVWVECNKCKIKTDYFRDNNSEDAKIKATKYWNRRE